MAKRTTRRSRGGSAPGRSEKAATPQSDAPERIASWPSEEDIRHRAYQRYLERGGGHGMDFEDWLEAERELRNSKVKS